MWAFLSPVWAGFASAPLRFARWRLRHRTVCAVAATIAVAGIAVGLYSFDPSATRWAPKCLFHELTGWACPGCGLQRALHALLHGDFAAAWRFNPFLLVGIPYLSLVLLATYGRSRLLMGLCRIVLHRFTIMFYAFLTVAWWVVRNVWAL